MAEEYKGEWKLLKVWECHKCKALIRDGRKVYDHICNQNGDKQEKVVEKVVEKIVEKIVYVEIPTVTAPIPTTPTEDVEDNLDTTNRDNVEATNRDNIETTNDHIETTNRDNVETTTNDSFAFGDETNRDNVETTTNDSFAFGDETNIEDFISGEAFTNARINTEETERMCLDVWKEDAGSIKDSKDTGYRDDIEIEIFERGKGKKRVIIKNGRVQKKPKGIEIIGKKSPSGFIVQGVIKRM